MKGLTAERGCPDGWSHHPRIVEDCAGVLKQVSVPFPECVLGRLTVDWSATLLCFAARLLRSSSPFVMLGVPRCPVAQIEAQRRTGNVSLTKAS